jgi:hypothetical protein
MVHGRAWGLAAALALAAAGCSGDRSAGEPTRRVAQATSTSLSAGRYLGDATFDGIGAKLAIVLDVFVEQPDDLTQYPRLRGIFKMSLGGYGTPEYVTEVFDDIQYDFGQGVYTLDGLENDWVISAKVESNGAVTFDGSVWVRSSATAGTMHLVYQSDEPPDDFANPPVHRETQDGGAPDAPPLPLLSGFYVGTCGTDRAAIQLLASKGLVADDRATGGLHGYAVTAKLAFDDPRMCSRPADSPTAPAWCVQKTYGSGTYNLVSGRLILEDDHSADACDVRGGTLSCRVTLGQTTPCTLVKPPEPPLPPVFHYQAFALAPTPEQSQPLPAIAPPENTAIVAALTGLYQGYVHHELTDRYQPIALNVIASSSTLNPHNPNNVYVSATVVSHFGAGAALASEVWPESFDRRSFSPGLGFVLSGQSSDAFLAIDTWKQGFIQGTWYSHAFGKVGTVQLVKSTPPPLPAGTLVVTPISGEYEGPVDGPRDLDRMWWFKTIVPTQPPDSAKSTLSFVGEIRIQDGILPPLRIDHGAFDMYTGAIGWVTEASDGRTIGGTVGGDGAMQLVWRGASVYGTPLEPTGALTFARTSP